jgi:hypothetical protein
MNDYLSQIIAANQSTAGMIEPRVPALFEPVVAPPSFDFGEMNETSFASPIQTPSAQDHSQAFNLTVSSDTDTLALPSLRASDPLPVAQYQPTQNNSTPRSVESIPNSIPIRLRAPLEFSRNDNAGFVSESDPRRENEISRFISRSANDVTQPTLIPSQPLPAEPQSRFQTIPLIKLVAAREPIVSPSFVVHPRIAPSEPLPDEIKPTQPPVIRVTIGRIEVRANMTTPAPPHSSVPHLPKLSLDDYLKSQRRGEQ